jgi:hypothetical protein
MNTYDSGSAAAMGPLMAMIMSFFWVFTIIGLLITVCQWMIFSKAGKPGWAAIIPIYNFIVLLQVVGKPWWWLILMIIPFVNFIIIIIILNELSKSFGKGVGFTLGLLFLPIIFFPILAFGSAPYNPPAGGSVATA